jgi:hypothetical protein
MDMFWTLVSFVPYVLGIAAAYGLYRMVRFEHRLLRLALREYRMEERSLESLERFTSDLAWRWFKYAGAGVSISLLIRLFGREQGGDFLLGLITSIALAASWWVTRSSYRTICN